MNFSRNQIIVIGVIFIIILFFVLVLAGVLPGLKSPGSGRDFGPGGQTEIIFWGVDDSSNISPLLDEYSKINKSVRIAYRQYEESDYEKNLLNALASGQGPDILMFHSSWLKKHGDKVSTLGPQQFSLPQFRQLFPTVAEQNLVSEWKTDGRESEIRIFALPLYMDTLALFYNKDVFDAKAIVRPPATWTEFQNIIPNLRELNESGQIAKAGAAIGGSGKSVDVAADLLELLMRQFGAQMIDKDGRIDLGAAGLKAFNFYLQFANASSPYHAWNENFRRSMDAFADGSTAMIFNYASKIPAIKEKNPFLNFDVAAMPQINLNKPLNRADYWGLAVSKQSKNQSLAWNFIFYLTTDPRIAEQYVQTSQKPPALKSLIQKYLEDPSLGVFVKQALTARSWQEPDSGKVRQIFSNMIESALNGRLSPENALKTAENELNNLR